jgi:SpoVK/Ycf46/Vps4 family AAA+-type ATPase
MRIPSAPTSLYQAYYQARFALNFLHRSSLPPDGNVLSFLARFWTSRELCGMLAEHMLEKQAEDAIMAKRLRLGDTSYVLREVAKQWDDDVPGAVKKELAGRLAAAMRELRKRGVAGDPMAARLRVLGRMFNLSTCARQCLLLLFIMEDAGGAFRNGFERFWPSSGVRGRLRYAAVFTGWSFAAVSQELAKDSALRRYGLVDRELNLGQHVVEFLCGLNHSPIQSNYFETYKGDALPLAAYGFMAREVELVERLILSRRPGRGVNLLFYGTPGTGKTELARAFGAHLGYAVHEIRTMDGRDAQKEENFRFAALYACQKIANPARSLIVIDEADEMLNAPGGLFASPRNQDKGTVNILLDQAPGVQIWITNAFSAMDESIRRRFDYSIEFRPFTPAQRQAVWRKSMERHGMALFPEYELQELSRRFPVNAGGIDLAVRNYRNMLQNAGRPDACQKAAAETMHAVLKSHLALLRLKESSTDTVFADYSLEGVNIRGGRPLADYVQIMRRFSEHLDCTDGNDGGIRNMNLLLSGPPGTGKTEWTKFFSRELGRPLVAKRGSDLLSMYVGGTEQQLRQAFREAEAAKAILFLDEADSFLQARNRAVRSWEVTQVNELLTCMEDYRGILVCATNFKDNLDQAALRRFNLKIEFDYLDAEGVVKFYGRFLTPMISADLTPAEIEALRRMDGLTPGDFKVVWQKHAFLPAAEITHDMLLNALTEEVNGRRIGKIAKMGFSTG